MAAVIYKFSVVSLRSNVKNALILNLISCWKIYYPLQFILQYRFYWCFQIEESILKIEVENDDVVERWRPNGKSGLKGIIPNHFESTFTEHSRVFGASR